MIRKKKALLSILLIFTTMLLLAAPVSAKKKKTPKVKPILNITSATIGVGQSLPLTVTNGVKVKWSSSKKKIAKVKGGRVTAKKVGKVTITATAKGKKAKCKITVVAAPQDLNQYFEDGAELEVVSNTVVFPVTVEGAGTITSVKARKYHTVNNPVSGVRYDFEICGNVTPELLQKKTSIHVDIKLMRSDGSGSTFFTYYVPICVPSLTQNTYGRHKTEGSVDSNGNFKLIWHQNEDSIPDYYDKANIVSVTKGTEYEYWPQIKPL